MVGIYFQITYMILNQQCIYQDFIWYLFSRLFPSLHENKDRDCQLCQTLACYLQFLQYLCSYQILDQPFYEKHLETSLKQMSSMVNLVTLFSFGKISSIDGIGWYSHLMTLFRSFRLRHMCHLHLNFHLPQVNWPSQLDIQLAWWYLVQLETYCFFSLGCKDRVSIPIWMF